MCIVGSCQQVCEFGVMKDAYIFPVCSVNPYFNFKLYLDFIALGNNRIPLGLNKTLERNLCCEVPRYSSNEGVYSI